MHDRADALLREDPAEQFAILDVTFVEGNTIRYGEAESSAEIVDHRHGITGVPQREHGMTANISGSASDEDGIRKRIEVSRHFNFAFRKGRLSIGPRCF